MNAFANGHERQLVPVDVSILGTESKRKGFSLPPGVVFQNPRSAFRIAGIHVIGITISGD